MHFMPSLIWKLCQTAHIVSIWPVFERCYALWEGESICERGRDRWREGQTEGRRREGRIFLLNSLMLLHGNVAFANEFHIRLSKDGDMLTTRVFELTTSTLCPSLWSSLLCLIPLQIRSTRSRQPTSRSTNPSDSATIVTCTTTLWSTLARPPLGWGLDCPISNLGSVFTADSCIPCHADLPHIVHLSFTVGWEESYARCQEDLGRLPHWEGWRLVFPIQRAVNKHFALTLCSMSSLDHAGRQTERNRLGGDPGDPGRAGGTWVLSSVASGPGESLQSTSISEFDKSLARLDPCQFTWLTDPCLFGRVPVLPVALPVREPKASGGRRPAQEQPTHPEATPPTHSSHPLLKSPWSHPRVKRPARKNLHKIHKCLVVSYSPCLTFPPEDLLISFIIFSACSAVSWPPAAFLLFRTQSPSSPGWSCGFLFNASPICTNLRRNHFNYEWASAWTLWWDGVLFPPSRNQALWPTVDVITSVLWGVNFVQNNHMHGWP